MLERIGDNDVLVRNYTSNFDIKEYIQAGLIPEAFPNIPVSKLNLGLTGIVSEMISQAIEDAYGTASLMMNEAFITRAVLPDSIYSAASLYNIGYSFAVPAKCTFALQIWLPDIIKYSVKVSNTNTYRYQLDKNTKIILGENAYRFDYDVVIDHQFIEGQRVFNIYYNNTENNSISNITNKYIKHQVSSIDWLVLFVDLQEYDRKVDVASITDNLVTTNSEIPIRWTRQIAGLDLVYITPQGRRLSMLKKTQYTTAEINPFAWYRFVDDQTINLSFSSTTGYFTPAFNSKLEYTVYTCNGASANFDSYDRKGGVPVQRTGSRFSYNANTKMVALCYSGATGGLNRGNIEDLRRSVILAYNTANVISTDHDLKLWFETYADKYGCRSEFFKRRDDPTGRLFSQFIAVTDGTYVFPTNTLTITVSKDQFDHINSDENGVDNEFIIEPGHLWEYDDPDDVVPDEEYDEHQCDRDCCKFDEDYENHNRNLIRDRVRMVMGVDGKPARIGDPALPQINSNRKFMFVNPFYMKIHKDPTVMMSYNYLIDHTSWPENIPINTECFYQFQLATFSIERSLSVKYNNKYRLQVICVPSVTTDATMKYIEGIGDGYSIEDNNLRLVLVTRTATDGETGYIEMTPVEIRNGGSILYEAYIAVSDNLTSDMKLEVDLERTPGMNSLMRVGEYAGKVLLDSSETSFHFICLMKDLAGTMTTTLYGDKRYSGYMMANRFANAHRDLILYKPMSMMRSVITFPGNEEKEGDGHGNVSVSLIPFLKYDIPLDDDKMARFVQIFGDQYKAMEPVLTRLGRLDGNSFLDFKLFNTYGRSNNYYIGPKGKDPVLWNSDILLDDVNVRIKLRISVHDRSMYTQTADSVVNDITDYFDALSSGNTTDVHVSDIIHMILEKEPNVDYIRFLGFNDYDANKQSIFVKYSEISELRQDQLQPYVPEMIRVDPTTIDIVEEV